MDRKLAGAMTTLTGLMIIVNIIFFNDGVYFCCIHVFSSLWTRAENVFWDDGGVHPLSMVIPVL
jgi:hypothetical protein